MRFNEEIELEYKKTKLKFKSAKKELVDAERMYLVSKNRYEKALVTETKLHKDYTKIKRERKIHREKRKPLDMLRDVFQCLERKELEKCQLVNSW